MRNKDLDNRRIAIMGVWYTITKYDFNKGKAEDDEDQQWGSCTYNDKSIMLDTNIPASQEKAVCYHEVTHAILQEAHVDTLIQKTIAEAVEYTIKGKTIDLAELALRIEEAVCDSMEVGAKSFKNI